WEYLSVAVQHGLKYLQLDDHINLGNYQFDDFYAQAKVKVSGKKPGEWITRTGKSVTYGLTLIKGAANRDGAVLFLDYLLDPEGGLAVLKSMGQPPFVPCRVPTEQMREMLPDPLKARVEVRN
ncbi:MAG: extracellular solute-binding protein, partial [Desulfobacterales bacterium]